MKLGAKLLVLFGIGLAIMAILAILGLPRVVASITETQLLSMARTVGGYLVHDLTTLPFGGDETAFEKAIDGRFEFVSSLGDKTGNFRVNKVILVDRNLRVEIGHPDGEIGADYSAHADLREAFGASDLAIVLEPVSGSSGSARDRIEADIVAPLNLADGDARVLEVKLDFSATLSLLSSQYARVLLIAAPVIAVSLGLIVGMLLLGVRRTVVMPLLAVSNAMERLGAGELDVQVAASGKDEIAMMGRHFNEMARGLRERFELERYVSRSTVDIARERSVAGTPGKAKAIGHRVERKILTVLFSDVRGFTSYSERTDPGRVIAILNLLLGTQEQIVAARSGYVDKFVGDETMAIFDHPSDAVAAALEIRDSMASIAGEIDGLALGIGIHSGELVEGDVGSPTMMNHTVIGDTVNIAARLQATATTGQVIVSDTIARDAEVGRLFELASLGGIRVKGKERPIDSWEVRGRRAGTGKDTGRA